MDLLKALILVSEKAANIARVCRRDEHLFDLLVQRKNRNEANPRFVDDFKTLADVLIQEMVKHDIGSQFQGLSNHINGEENNVFKNKLGDEIRVEVKPSEQETSILLGKVLNGDQIAADLLAAEVHRELKLNNIDTTVPQQHFDVNLNELGIWIDPIDCTAGYVHGGIGKCDHNIHVDGLKCVTILIGVFNRTTGIPVMGVINRPFLEEVDYQFSQQCIWGISVSNFVANSGMIATEKKTNIICVSNIEDTEIKERLRENGYHLIEASGAGYKILTVILGLADAYLLTKGTTFKWDTCAPQAILNSLGGDIVGSTECMRSEGKSITYFSDEENCNSNGIIAFRNRNILDDIVNILKK